MITPAYIQTMARYNAWQNRSLYGAADGLEEDTRFIDWGGQVHAMLTAAGATPDDTDLPFIPED